MRRLLPIALVATGLVLAACGEDEPTTTTAATETASTSATTVAEQPPADEPSEEQEGGGAADGAVAPEPAGADPKSALEAFFVSGDPDLVCGTLATAKLLSSAYGDEQGCRQAQVPAATPKSIEIRSLDESGDRAQALVVPEGGPNDGFDHEVVLVREGDAWLVDSIEADIPAGP